MLQQAKILQGQPTLMILTIFLFAVGVAIGVFVGIERAFWLKLEAQKVLCQLQTEINTRTGGQP
jgi:hypothetical protein